MDYIEYRGKIYKVLSRAQKRGQIVYTVKRLTVKQQREIRGTQAFLPADDAIIRIGDTKKHWCLAQYKEAVVFISEDGGGYRKQRTLLSLQQCASRKDAVSALKTAVSRGNFELLDTFTARQRSNSLGEDYWLIVERR